jgi:sulfur carrier protein ThiS
MDIRVKLLVGLKKYSPSGEPQFDLEVAKDASVEEVLQQLGIPRQPVKVVLVNGRQAQPQHKLKGHDLLVVFPPLEGG